MHHQSRVPDASPSSPTPSSDVRVVDFGYFRCGKGKRYLLSWEDGRLLLDGDIISYIPTEEEARRTLDGWYENCDRENALVWLAGRLATVDSPGWAR